MVYITGDMHGDESRFLKRDIRKLKEGDVLIVAGDFGFLWNGDASEKKALDYLGSRKYTVCFLDGPHDNYDLIYKCRKTVWKSGHVHRISGNLFHMCRGQIFNIQGLRIFTFGGGESADKEIRSEMGRWWKEEIPSPEEMIEGAENLLEVNKSVDVIITHEPPSLIKSAMLLRNGKTDEVNRLNGYFEDLNRNCNFKMWYFGSMHEDRIITAVHTSVFKTVVAIPRFEDRIAVTEFSSKIYERKNDVKIETEIEEAEDEDGVVCEQLL